MRAHFDTNQFVSFRVKEVASNFNDLCVGDLAFPAMAIGMKNSSGAHCAHCLLKASEFNVDMQLPNNARTKASLRTCLNEHHRLRTTQKSTRNHRGMNNIGLLDIDPQRTIVPVLHRPMGLADKVLETFKCWTIYEIEKLPDGPNQIRETCRTAIANHVAAKANEVRVTAQQVGNNTPESAALQREAQDAKANVKSEETKAKKQFDEMVKRHNAKLFSLSQRFDCIFRSHKTKKEHSTVANVTVQTASELWERHRSCFKSFLLPSRPTNFQP